MSGSEERARAAEEQKQGGQFWTPIPPLRGSKLHAETHTPADEAQCDWPDRPDRRDRLKPPPPCHIAHVDDDRAAPEMRKIGPESRMIRDVVEPQAAIARGDEPAPTGAAHDPAREASRFRHGPLRRGQLDRRACEKRSI